MPMCLNPPSWRFTLLFKCFRAPAYVLRCSDLCEDFEEDLQFHFSLGLNTLLVSRFELQLLFIPTIYTLLYSNLLAYVYHLPDHRQCWLLGELPPDSASSNTVHHFFGVWCASPTGGGSSPSELSLETRLYVASELCTLSSMTVVFPACSRSFHA